MSTGHFLESLSQQILAGILVGSCVQDVILSSRAMHVLVVCTEHAWMGSHNHNPTIATGKSGEALGLSLQELLNQPILAQRSQTATQNAVVLDTPQIDVKTRWSAGKHNMLRRTTTRNRHADLVRYSISYTGSAWRNVPGQWDRRSLQRLRHPKGLKTPRFRTTNLSQPKSKQVDQSLCRLDGRRAECGTRVGSAATAPRAGGPPMYFNMSNHYFTLPNTSERAPFYSSFSGTPLTSAPSGARRISRRPGTRRTSGGAQQ